MISQNFLNWNAFLGRLELQYYLAHIHSDNLHNVQNMTQYFEKILPFMINLGNLSSSKMSRILQNLDFRRFCQLMLVDIQDNSV